MRSRLLDVVLIVGLVVVAGGIMWTLFNLGSTSQPAATPVTPAAPSAGPTRPTGVSGPTVTPVSPNTVVTPPAEAESESDDETAAPGTPVAQPPTGPEAVPAAAPPAPRAVPPGTVALERVGFSFATGGTGACGVVLEPWRHVAVSRDLLAAYGCGAEVTVTLDDPAGDRSELVGVIGDTMNPSFELTVNVYVAEDEPAFQYGLTTGTFTPR